MTERPASVGSSEQEEPTGPVIRDKRRIDPDTGDVRASDEGQTPMSDETPEVAKDLPEQELGGEDAAADPTTPASADQVHPDTALAAERLESLQRLQAEHVNYRRRMERDRERDRESTTARIIEAMAPVMDDIYLAREHGELEGTPFEKIADKLQLILERYGFEQFGAVGEPFDPTRHEALMHVQAELPEGTEGTTVVQVMQPGFRVGDRIVRAARVGVADPQ